MLFAGLPEFHPLATTEKKLSKEFDRSCADCSDVRFSPILQQKKTQRLQSQRTLFSCLEKKIQKTRTALERRSSSASPSSTCHLDQHPRGTSASLVYSSQRFEFVPEKKPAYEAQLSLPGRGSRGLRRAAPRRLLAPARVAALLSAVYRILFRSRRSCRKSNTIPPECHFCTQSM